MNMKNDGLNKEPILFIVGNSRSGTTMMMRIMNNHSMVHSINEPHFFEKMWTPKDNGVQIDRNAAENIYAQLFTGQREGFFESVKEHKHKFDNEISKLLEANKSGLTRLAVYTTFVHYETREAGKSIPCEKTPKNVFYLNEILAEFPNARIINMVRDPRAVMLSQKLKWMRRSLGAHFMTKRESLRLQINYHPLAVSKLWNAAVGFGHSFRNDPRVMTVRFEDIIDNPEETVKEICSFAEIPFEKNLLNVPHAGSSSEADKKSQRGIRKSQKKGWLEKGLSPVEIQICQDVCRKYMDIYGYEAVDVRVSSIKRWQKYALFPFKMSLALLININRMRSIGDTLKRRLTK